MNLQRREEIKVIAECPNDRHWAQEMRRAVADLLAHIDALEQAAAERVIADGKARAVVAPELTWQQCTDIANEAQKITGRSIWPSTVGAIANVMRSRAIPADRVLGYAEIPVKEGVWQRAYLLIRRSRKLATEGGSSGCWRMHNEDADKFLSEFTAYSANQGGTEG